MPDGVFNNTLNIAGLECTNLLYNPDDDACRCQNSVSTKLSSDQKKVRYLKDPDDDACRCQNSVSTKLSFLRFQKIL
jgi:hypothetical protein